MLYTHDRALIGALVLHVDDLLVGGEQSNKEFQAAIANLRKIFDFGKWQELLQGGHILYCGGKLERTKKGISLGYADYIRKIAPLTVNRNYKESAPLGTKEIGKLRGLIGALQWPAGQGLPTLSASLSIQAAGVPTATNQLVGELNKTLRFAKTQDAYRLSMNKVFDSLEDMCMVVFSDAAFAVRPDGSSQGGLLVVLTSRRVLSGETVPYTVLSWRSHKLQRVCRSSLSAEAQSLATSLDELVMVKSMVSLMLDPLQDPRDQGTAQWPGSSVAVVDAKALYDALKKPGFTSSQDKRTAIEILCIQDELKRLQTTLRWVSSERMLADGLTKIASRQDFASMLGSGYLSLVYDENFVAAKKKSKEERERSQQASGGRYGSRIAQHIATVLLAQTLETTEGKTLDETATPHGDYYLDLFLGVVMLQFSIMLAYLVYKAVSYLTTSRPRTATTTRATQTNDLPRDTELFHLRNMATQYRNDIDTHREHVAQVQAECTGLWRQLEDTRAERDSLRRQSQRRQRDLPARVLFTPSGQCYHPDPDCPHLRGARIRPGQSAGTVKGGVAEQALPRPDEQSSKLLFVFPFSFV